MAKRRTTFRLFGSRQEGGGCLYWFLVALTVAGLLIWWETNKGKGAKPSPPPTTPQAQLVSTNGPVVQRMVRQGTNVVVTTNATIAVETKPPTNAPPPPPPPPVREIVTNAIIIPRRVVPTNAVVLPPPGVYPRPVQTLFEAQVALARLAISPGSLDGLIGSQTRSALRTFQEKEQLEATGELDDLTRERLVLEAPPYTNYVVTSNDLARLQPVKPTWMGKSQQSALDFETILELVAEKGRAYPSLIRKLNPRVNWTNVSAGETIVLPAIADPPVPRKAAFVRISLSGKVLEAFDSNTNLLAHFPCSIAQRVEKRPVGELHVVVAIPNPNYTFDPDVFPESEEARRIKNKLVIPPGPNNPVGLAWIGLDRAGYGMHGTPNPEQVGRTESHGCFRLANWNAEFLLKLVWVGMPVYVVP